MMNYFANVSFKYDGKTIAKGDRIPDDLLDKLGEDGLRRMIKNGKYSTKKSDSKPSSKTSSKKKVAKKKASDDGEG